MYQDGEKLRALRERSQLSISALAQMLGVTPMTIYRAEQGGPCSNKLLRKIADAFHVQDWRTLFRADVPSSARKS